jgi:predicted acyltransferase
MMPHRSAALDALRGATVALMILVNNPGSWQHIYAPLAHAPWHGLTPTDWVFPFFLFVVGASMAFALDLAAPARAFWPLVLRRAALIFAIGLFLNASPFVRWNEAGELSGRAWETLRFMGVLQRIALAYLGAAVLLRALGAARAVPAASALLFAYWLACVALANGSDPYSLEGFFGTAWDRALLGASHLYRGEGVPFDPEGLASTAPAIAQVLLGAQIGAWLRRGPLDAALLRRLLVAATVLIALGLLWSLAMPINKKLWTSSYVLVTSGLAMVALAALVQALDRRGSDVARGALATWALAFGRNALFVFVLAGLLPRLLALARWRGADGAWTSPLPWLYRHVFAALPGDPRLGSLAYALVVLAAFSALALWMHRRGWTVRV